MTESSPDYARLLEKALESPLGLKVSTNNPIELRRILAELASKEDRFAGLKFRMGLDAPSELWIVKEAEQTDEPKHSSLDAS